ncbi:P-loop containing nucleoside triphosphate hydrolase protein, partial [Dunaliella salina]
LSEADNIKVAVRVRPLLPHEKEKGATSVLNVPEDHSTVEVVMPGPSGNKLQRDFQFHACLGPDTTQTEVMQLCGVHQLLDAVLAGYNVTIFAYGVYVFGREGLHAQCA